MIVKRRVREYYYDVYIFSESNDLIDFFEMFKAATTETYAKNCIKRQLISEGYTNFKLTFKHIKFRELHLSFQEFIEAAERKERTYKNGNR